MAGHGAKYLSRMKIMVSSKTLAIRLKQIDFEGGEYVTLASLIRVKSSQAELVLSTENKSVSIPVEILEHTMDYDQHNRRWDWIKDLVNKVDEQPITLEIYEQVVNVKFQY